MLIQGRRSKIVDCHANSSLKGCRCVRPQAELPFALKVQGKHINVNPRPKDEDSGL